MSRRQPRNWSRRAGLVHQFGELGAMAEVG